ERFAIRRAEQDARAVGACERMAAGQDGAGLDRLDEAGDTGRRQLELVEVGEIELDRFLGCQPEQGADALTAILRHEAQDTITERAERPRPSTLSGRRHSVVNAV